MSDSVKLHEGRPMWIWRWNMNALTAQKKADLDNLMFWQLLIILKDFPDEWRWDDVSQHQFSSRCIKKLLAGNGVEGEYILKWNQWALITVNIFMWQTLHNKIATCDSLSRRGIEIQSHVCKLCGIEDETTENLFISCGLTSHIWSKVSVWCSINPVFVFYLRIPWRLPFPWWTRNSRKEFM